MKGLMVTLNTDFPVQLKAVEGIWATVVVTLPYTGRFIMFSVITNIYSRKTQRPTLMELFTATRKLKEFFFFTTRDVRCVHHG